MRPNIPAIACHAPRKPGTAPASSKISEIRTARRGCTANSARANGSFVADHANTKGAEQVLEILAPFEPRGSKDCTAARRARDAENCREAQGTRRADQCHGARAKRLATLWNNAAN